MFHAKVHSFGFMQSYIALVSCDILDFHIFNFISEKSEKICAGWEFKYEKKPVDQFKSKGGKNLWWI